jgi:cytochrome P450
MPQPASFAPSAPPQFPLARGCPFDPPAEYAALRAERPVTRVRVPSGQEAWLVTRHEDVRRLLTDARVSADRGHPNLPLTEAVTPASRQAIAAVGRSLIGLDPPEHGARRGLLITEFTVRRINTLRPYIQRVVDGFVDDLLAGPRPADLVTALCLPVPSLVLCELLGVPYEDREFFQHRATVQVRRGVAPEERQKAGAELRGYLDRLITGKEAAPGDDLLGRLIVRNRAAAADGEAPFDHALLVGLAMLLMAAGHESTANMLSLGVAGLLENPEQLAAIAGDPAAVPMAMEELLRYFAIVDTMPRVAKADIEIGGVTVRAGEGLLIGFASANRDGAAFADPDTLDVRRGARHHVAFGYGVHQCIGQNLARAEMEIVFRTLIARVPGLKLAVPLDELPFKDDSSVYGLDRLPVTW